MKGRGPREWEQRRERLRQIIGLDRVEVGATVSQPSVEVMLKSARENFGHVTPVLGHVVRKYMHHRPRGNPHPIQIHGGKVRSTFFALTSEDNGLHRAIQ